MATVRRGLDDMRELQRYVDAQAGGPGKGFFQIVTDPYEARRVINAGKMAVVLEIEVSEPFGCRGWDAPTCDRAKVDRELDDLYRRGVRSALLLNKFDNPLAGVRFDSGPPGRDRQRRQRPERRLASGARGRARARCATTRSPPPRRCRSPGRAGQPRPSIRRRRTATRAG